jgi:uncharacterized protein YggE
MRRSLPLVLVAAAAAFVVALLGGVGRSDAALHDASSAANTVTTTGHGVGTAVPDKAQVTAGVQTQATTAADALAENARLMNKVVAALTSAGGSDLQTQQVSLYPRTNESGDVVGFTAADTVTATARIADAGGLVDAAVAAGANTVDGPSLSVSDRDGLYRAALAKAMADARAKALALGNAGGFGVGAVSSVTEETAGAPVPVLEAAAAKSSDTPVEPGTQDVTADVSVTFAIN